MPGVQHSDTHKKNGDLTQFREMSLLGARDTCQIPTGARFKWFKYDGTRFLKRSHLDTQKIWSSWTNRTSSPIRNPNPKNYVENLKIHVFFHMWDPIQSFSRTWSDIIISHTFTQKLPNKWGDGWYVTFLTPPCNAAWYESSSPRCYKLQILKKYVFLRLIAHNNLPLLSFGWVYAD